MATDTRDWVSFQLAAALDGRPVVAFNDVLAPMGPFVDALRDHGVLRVRTIAGSRGTGEVDPAVARDALVLDLAPARDMMGGIRSFLAVMDRPPGDVVEAVEAFDPQREAIVSGPLFTEVQAVLRRRVFGARPYPWQKLEDKTVIDAFWDRAGVVHTDSMVVPARLQAMEEAAASMDRGAGTVWVADNRSGWHGGGASTRWVTDGVDPREVAAELALHADQVRVMPFLEGLPCSIHGWVFDDHLAAFQPVEMVVLRDLAAHRLVYAGAATTWRPDATVVAEMQTVARRVGAQLRDEVDYRGSFTVDGVLTEDGFRPTELNPRYGAGLGVQARATGLPLYLLHCATIERPDLDWRPEELEAMVNEASLANPLGAAHTLTPEPLEDAVLHLAVVDGAFRLADTGPVRIETGPSPSGGMIRVHLDDDLGGAPTAPYAAAAINAVADLTGHGLPFLTPAPL